MRYDSADRVLSISFVRDPEEHADVIVEAGRRMFASPEPSDGGTTFLITIGFGALVGIVMEIHRRFILPLVLDPSRIAPFGPVTLQLLPLIFLLVALYFFLQRRQAKRNRSALRSRLQPALFIDVDIFTKGVAISGGHAAAEVDWPAVRNIFVVGNRIEIEGEDFVTYIPARAFSDREALIAAAKKIRNVWREAAKRDHDNKMTAAGVD